MGGGTTVVENETTKVVVTETKALWNQPHIIRIVNYFLGCGSCCMIIGSIIMLALAVSAHSYAQVDISSVQQVVYDWGTKPFVDINVRASCLSGEDDIFTNYYAGVSSGCKRYE